MSSSASSSPQQSEQAVSATPDRIKDLLKRFSVVGGGNSKGSSGALNESSANSAGSGTLGGNNGSMPNAKEDTPANQNNSSNSDINQHPIDAVFFIVHGIGSQDGDSVLGLGKYSESIAALKKSYKDVLREEFVGDGPVIEWIPIEWHSILHALESSSKRMSLISLPTTPVFRQINNDILADILFFFSSYHAPHLLAIVADLLNDAYAKFMRSHPNFDGLVALLGHSLGGIICYDILAHQHDNPAFVDPAHVVDLGEESEEVQFHNHKKILAKHPFPVTQTHYEVDYPTLKFKPNFLFSMGSPLGGVMVFRGHSPECYKLPDGIIYSNIFHLFDPLGYRIEPLYDASYADHAPVLLQRPSATSARIQKRIRKAFESTWKDSRAVFAKTTFVSSIRSKLYNQSESGSSASLSSSMMTLKPPSFLRKPNQEGGGASRPASALGREERPSTASTLSQEKLTASNEKSTGSQEKLTRISPSKGLKSLSHWVTKIMTLPNWQPSRPASPDRVDMETPANVSEGKLVVIDDSTGGATATVLDDDAEPVSFDAKINIIMDTAGNEDGDLSHDLGGLSTEDDEAMYEPMVRKVEQVAESWTVLENDPEMDKKPENALPRGRVDFFITESIVDSMIHQYLVGMKAHFSYWANKDVMHFLLSRIKNRGSSIERSFSPGPDQA